ncbi:COQ9 family protein [Roseovarius aestuariivivens]|uniref:COQ9 family protein n=1 Tax=Roseovarius aestuariivivens TaxID=1888910 RepID=UPI00108087CB|nr:COQ9 family protein [Roseovarius aestuariivivens]
MTDTDVKAQLLEAIKPHVPFDGWTDAALRAAMEDIGISRGLAQAACPRGAVDLALAFHEEGDQAMLLRLDEANLADMRFRDRIAAAVRFRLEVVEDKELVRRGATLFALPHYAMDGSRAIWGTCDRIWTALGDTSDDINWYTKRATLAGVYSATVLYWLGDESEGHARTWEFLDRRIDNVMQIEKIKAQVRENKVLSSLMAGPMAVLGKVRPPQGRGATGMPGRWSR